LNYNARCGRAGGWFCLAALGLLNVGCSGGNSDRGVNTAVGTSAGVAITTSTGLTQLQAGDTLVLSAAVTNDKNNAGVSWILDGDGALSSVTTTSATYTAPTAFSGNSTPFITATSIADNTQVATATLVVAGDPIIDPPALFPANLSSPYSANVIAVGGKAPFVWTLTSGTLPAGITEAGSTATFETLSGTPTATGSFPLQLTVTDANSKTATTSVILTVNPATSCLLAGQYAVLSSGISSGALATRAIGLNIASGGAITGILDRKSGSITTAAQALTGTCTNLTANSGTLTLTGSGDSPNFNYAVTASLTAGRVQLTNGADASTASGLFYQQSPAAFTLASIAGSYALGLQGAESAGERRFGVVGRLTISATGTITAGRVDTNGSTALSASAATGSLTAPDSNGRGTLTVAAGGQTFNLVYYVVDANRLLVAGADSNASAARLSGFMTRQQLASFDSTALAGPGVLSLWGNTGATIPSGVLSVGRLSGANTGTGVIALLLDTADRGTTLATQNSTSGSYTVESDGRVTLNVTISGAARSFSLYLDAASNGYVIERGATSGAAGMLEAQMAAPYPRTLPGQFVSGTQFAQSGSPLVTAPSNFISSSSITSGTTSGFAAINTTSGRGIGSLSTSGLASTNFAFYIVQPNKAVLLRFGNANQNPTIDWYMN
jgi:hypothetical protein